MLQLGCSVQWLMSCCSPCTVVCKEYLCFINIWIVLKLLSNTSQLPKLLLLKGVRGWLHVVYCILCGSSIISVWRDWHAPWNDCSVPWLRFKQGISWILGSCSSVKVIGTAWAVISIAQLLFQLPVMGATPLNNHWSISLSVCCTFILF